MGYSSSSGIMYGVQVHVSDLLNAEGTLTVLAQAIGVYGDSDRDFERNEIMEWLNHELMYQDFDEDGYGIIGFSLCRQSWSHRYLGNFSTHVPNHTQNFDMGANLREFTATAFNAAIETHAPHILDTLGVYSVFHIS